MSQPLKMIPSETKTLYLTFDDGPCAKTTPQVLDILDEFNAPATFFVIGDKVKKNLSLVQQVLQKGHSVGNHSWDHAYHHYFKNKDHLKNWVLQSQRDLTQLLGQDPVAFRSPAGIVTPPLKQAMQEVGIPWVHWNKRFFDTNVPLSWTAPWVSFRSGDIVLLHDCQRPSLAPHFFRSLREMLGVLGDKGFDFQALNKEKFGHDC